MCQNQPKLSIEDVQKIIKKYTDEWNANPNIFRCG